MAGKQDFTGQDNLSKGDKLPKNVEEKFSELKASVDKDRENRGLASIKSLLENKSIDSSDNQGKI
jgi:hypothetical protein